MSVQWVWVEVKPWTISVNDSVIREQPGCCNQSAADRSQPVTGLHVVSHRQVYSVAIRYQYTQQESAQTVWHHSSCCEKCWHGLKVHIRFRARHRPTGSVSSLKQLVFSKEFRCEWRDEADPKCCGGQLETSDWNYRENNKYMGQCVLLCSLCIVTFLLEEVIKLLEIPYMVDSKHDTIYVYSIYIDIQYEHMGAVWPCSLTVNLLLACLVAMDLFAQYQLYVLK